MGPVMKQIENMSPIGSRLPRVGALLVVASLVFALGVPLTAIGKPDKVTICHAAGREGTDHYVTLNLAPQAVYGKAGHLNEDGTAQAGHEGDYLGACEVEDTTTTVAEDPTTTLNSTTTSTTTAPQTAPTTPETSTTSTVAQTPATEPTTTTSTSTTSTTSTIPEAVGSVSVTTTTTTPGSDDDPVDIAASNSGSRAASTTPAVSPVSGAPDAAVGAAETLPYTGIEETLMIPATLMLIGGAFLLFATGQGAGVHVSDSSLRFGLGLHRGRHEPRARE